MGKKFAGLSFYTKVLIVYICSLILSIVSITVNQTQTAADVLEEPIVVARATGTCVTPKECKRKKEDNELLIHL